MSIELTPELAPEFAVTVRGYDRAQVDEYIDWLREWLSNATVRMESAEAAAAHLREQVHRLQLRVDDLEAETSGEPPRTIAALGDRVTRILEVAEEGAAAVRAEAEAEAQHLVTRARAEAEALAQATAQRQAELDSRLSSATERAQQTVQEAEARAADAVARTMLDAETRAKAWEARAQQRARELVETAEQERSRVLELLTAEKAALDAQLEGLVAQRADVLAGLSRLHESLATTIVEVPPPEVSSPDPGLVTDPDDTDSHETDQAAGAADAEGGDAGGGRRRGGFREFLNAAAARDTGAAGRDAAGWEKERTVLFDREAVDDEPPPPAPGPTAFRRAGSQPEGSQRAGQ